MPLLVRLTDSEVYAVAGVVAQVSNGVKDGGGVLEEVGSAWLPIDQEPLLSDLHVEPIYGDVQPGGQFGCAEGAGFMVPSLAGRAHLDAGDVTDPLYGVGDNLFVARPVSRPDPHLQRRQLGAAERAGEAQCQCLLVPRCAGAASCAC